MENRLLFDRLARVDKKVPIPLYFQIKTAIVEMIDDGTLQVGDLLPPENEMAERVNVSRPTIRQAMSELVADGFLLRQQGKGTYVFNTKRDAPYFQEFQSFNEEMATRGMTPSTQVLAKEVVDGEPSVNLLLGRVPGEKLIYLRRLRCANGEPIIYSESFVPYEPFAALLDVDFTKESLLDSFRDVCGKEIEHVVRDVEAVNCPDDVAPLLQVPSGRAICLVKSLTYGACDEAVEYSVSRYRGDRTSFRLEINMRGES